MADQVIVVQKGGCGSSCLWLIGIAIFIPLAVSVGVLNRNKVSNYINFQTPPPSPSPAAGSMTEKEARAAAVQKYPQLGVAGSEMNKAFLAEYERRKKAEPAFFNDPQWPMTLADKVAR